MSNQNIEQDKQNISDHQTKLLINQCVIYQLFNILRTMLQVLVVLFFTGCSEIQKPLTHVERQALGIPLSEVSTQLNLRVSWNANQRQAILDRGEYRLIVEPNNSTAWFQGEPMNMEYPAYLDAKEIFIPRSFYEKLKGLIATKSEHIVIPPEDTSWQVSHWQSLPDHASKTTPSPSFSPYNQPLLSAPIPSSLSFRVAIDAGHGGRDPGASALQGQLQEKTFTLDIAQRLQQILNQWGIATVMTRNADTLVQLPDRVNMINKSQSNCLVSIHLNSAPSLQASGIELWIHENTQPSEQFRAIQSRRLSQYLHQTMRSKLSLKDRGIRKSNFYILQNTTIPAVLIEVGFMSHTGDLQAINTPTFRQDAAQAIAQGLLSYYGNEIAKVKP